MTWRALVKLSMAFAVVSTLTILSAGDAVARMRAPESTAERVAPATALDKAALAQRSRDHHAAGRHAEALADLEQSCRLEADAQIAELCMAEVADYAKTYNLPR